MWNFKNLPCVQHFACCADVHTFPIFTLFWHRHRHHHISGFLKLWIVLFNMFSWFTLFANTEHCLLLYSRVHAPRELWWLKSVSFGLLWADPKQQGFQLDCFELTKNNNSNKIRFLYQTNISFFSSSVGGWSMCCWLKTTKLVIATTIILTITVGRRAFYLNVVLPHRYFRKRDVTLMLAPT